MTVTSLQLCNKLPIQKIKAHSMGLLKGHDFLNEYLNDWFCNLFCPLHMCRKVQQKHHKFVDFYDVLQSGTKFSEKSIMKM